MKAYPAKMQEFISAAETRGLKVTITDTTNEYERTVSVKVGVDAEAGDGLVAVLDSFETVYLTAYISITAYSTNRWKMWAAKSDYNEPFHVITQDAALSAVRRGFYNAKVGA
jgi:hypothetical protein